jgi:predicted ATPase
MVDDIEHILIENFKSFRECELTNLRRISLLIGRLGRGKTNFLEVLSVASLPILRRGHHYELRRLLRETSIDDLFYHGNFARAAVSMCFSILIHFLHSC